MIETKIADKNDIEKLIPSFIKAFNDGEWKQKWTDATTKISLENIFSFPNFYGLVAKKEGETVGAILGHIQTFNDVKTYYIDELFIDPSYQKQGIAKKLYQKTIKDLRREGVTGSFFTTLRNSAAYDFYVSQGAIDLKDSAVFYHPF